MNIEALILLILLLPLIGGLSDYLLGHSRRFIATVFVAISFGLTLYLVLILENPYLAKLEWLPDFQIGIHVDKPAATLLALVAFISLLVHLFSHEYMKEDPSKHRYFAKLGFFTFSMMGLLIADNLILLFIFWELVGIASYLLIGFWFEKEEISSSARMAFMVNRVADVALFAGILMIYRSNGSLFISEIDRSILFLPSLFIAIGAFGKSAQLPFSGWLVKAMVGPTPISAFIHAATMVAAGVYLLFRVGPFLDSDVLVVIALIGVLTALYGAISAITQNDIKKVLAYSTVSQLGYMVMGIGVGAGEASLFHLWTHAFFKAGLFLGAGVIMHHLHQQKQFDAQDMRFMGGLRKKLPWTFVVFLVCGFALAGIPFSSGFMSKEGILVAAWAWADGFGTWAYLIPDVALITVLITAFYIGRLIVLVFLGENRSQEISKVIVFGENGFIKIPLALLALGSVWLVYNINPLAHHSLLDPFIGLSAVSSDSFISIAATGISILLSSTGLLLAFFFFKPGSSFSSRYLSSGEPVSIGGKLIINGLYLTSIYRGFGTAIFSASKAITWIEKQIDGFLHFIAVGGVVLSKVIAIFDRLIIDGLVNLSAWLAGLFGNVTRGVHSSQSQWQIIWLLISFVLILIWILFF